MKKYIKHLIAIIFVVIFLQKIIPVEFAWGNNEKLPLTFSKNVAPNPSFDSNANAQSSAKIKRNPVVHKLIKKQFRSDEDITFSVTNVPEESLKVSVVDSAGKQADVSIDQTRNMDQVLIDVSAGTQFRPGKYKVIVSDNDGFRSEQDFRWGVLAINTNRSLYQPGQNADLSIAVLDDKGNMVCDAQVSLRIRNQKLNIDDELSTKNGKIITNEQCKSHNFSLEPDYEARYIVGAKGDYEMTLTAQTQNGSFTITDKLVVDEQAAFDVERISATRIYPPNHYPVNITVTANQDFEGVITETVPESFAIMPSEKNNSYDNAQTLYLEKEKDPTRELTSQLSSSDSANVLGASTSALLLPFSGTYSITQGFGQINTADLLGKFYEKFSLSGHDGIDFGIPENTPLFATDDGNVVWAGEGDYGITVIIQHSWGKSYYGHLNKVSVEKDTYIKKGTQIGFSGNTGESTGPHLHFGIKPNEPDINNGYFGKVDPLAYFNLPTNAILATNANAIVNEAGVLGASSSATPTFGILDNQIRKTTLIQTTTANDDKVKILQWHVSLKKGEKTTLSYTFKAPDISPQFYLLGPLTFYTKDKAESLFHEQRQWQIAADAITTRKAPLLVDYNQSLWNDETSASEVTGTISWNINDVIVVLGATEDNAFTLGTPTATGLSFSLVTSTSGASNTRTYLWSATATANGASAVTSTVAGGTAARGISVFVYRGSEGVGANNTITGTTAKTISLTRNRDNSAVASVLADWNAVNDTTVSPTPSGGTQRVAQFMTSSATFFVDDWGDQSTAGTTSYGITSHTGTVDMSGIVVEIYGSNGTEWYNDGTPTGGYAWQYRKPITTTSSTSLIPSSQNQFPLLISLTTDSDLVANAQSDGDDILFTDINGNKLDHEIEKYTSSTGELVAWVEMPTLAVSTTIYLYYGNADASSQQNVNGTWDDNYKAVWHLKEVPTTTCSGSSEVCDSTSNANNGNAGGTWSSGQQLAGKVDGGLDFSSDDYFAVADSTSLDELSSSLTVSAWVKSDTFNATYRRIIARDSHPNQRWYMENDGAAPGHLLYETGGDGNSTTATLSTGTWYYVVMTANSSLVRMYINGASDSDSGTGPASISTVGGIGIGADAGGGTPWDGMLDEIRLSKTVRSADWITAEYNNMNSPSTFYTLGSVENKNYAPSPSQMMRHGHFFNSIGEIQPFTF